MELVMSKTSTISPAELETLDRFYREGGLRAMASPHVHYDEPTLPPSGLCSSHGVDRLQARASRRSGRYLQAPGPCLVGRHRFCRSLPGCRELDSVHDPRMEAVNDELARPVSPSSRQLAHAGSVRVRCGIGWRSMRPCVSMRSGRSDDGLVSHQRAEAASVPPPPLERADRLTLLGDSCGAAAGIAEQTFCYSIASRVTAIRTEVHCMARIFEKIPLSTGICLEKELGLRRITGCDSIES